MAQDDGHWGASSTQPGVEIGTTDGAAENFNEDTAPFDFRQWKFHQIQRRTDSVHNGSLTHSPHGNLSSFLFLQISYLFTQNSIAYQIYFESLIEGGMKMYPGSFRLFSPSI
jgi:hypothetical protein